MGKHHIFLCPFLSSTSPLLFSFYYLAIWQYVTLHHETAVVILVWLWNWKEISPIQHSSYMCRVFQLQTCFHIWSLQMLPKWIIELVDIITGLLCKVDKGSEVEYYVHVFRPFVIVFMSTSLSNIVDLQIAKLVCMYTVSSKLTEIYRFPPPSNWLVSSVAHLDKKSFTSFRSGSTIRKPVMFTAVNSTTLLSQGSSNACEKHTFACVLIVILRKRSWTRACTLAFDQVISVILKRK